MGAQSGVMIEGQGLFQLAARNAAYAALARDKGVAHYSNVFERSDNPSAFSGKSLRALTVDANTTIRAMFQAAWEKVHADENLISDDMIKRLEKASKSDNKEIAAELGIGMKTVEKHREHLMRKLDLHDTAGVTRYAISAGIIESSVQVTIV